MDIKVIQDNMQRCSAETEKIYTRLGSSFPSLISFLGEGSATLPSLEAVFRGLADGFRDFNSGDDGFFERYNARNTGLFRDLSERMSALSGINERVAAIRTDSEELEIISLNAMVISIKSGEKGRAFSCITENLKRLSARMISLSNELILDEKKLVERNDTLKASFSSVMAAQDGLAHSRTLDDAAIQAAIADASVSLSRISDEAKRVTGPIQEAMAGIQLQDIIRQSIDQVLLALHETRSVPGNLTPEDRLDKLTLDAELLDLCIRISKDVHANLERSIAIFTANWAKVHEILDSVEKLRLSFVSAYLDPRNRSHTSIPVILDGMSSGFQDYIAHIGIYQRGQQTMVRDSALIVTEVKRLRVLFDSIRPIISRLQHVRITQQIEVAKNPAIAAVKDTVDHMSVLIMQADERVQETKKELEQFISGIEELTGGYSQSAEADQRDLERIKQDKLRFFNEMKDLQVRLGSIVSGLQVYPDSFQSMCVEVDSLFASLRRAQQSVEEISVWLDGSLREFNAERESIMRVLGIDSWQIHDDRLRDLVQRFTITAHKEAAGEIGGFDVEKGGLNSIESGDVTLFF
ncbi:MAG TPA: hypothetical protein PKO22_00030 [Treponemataceae bacterium]|nr:hypothetical protein [Treponemataceae bacterium]